MRVFSQVFRSPVCNSGVNAFVDRKSHPATKNWRHTLAICHAPVLTNTRVAASMQLKYIRLELNVSYCPFQNKAAFSQFEHLP